MTQSDTKFYRVNGGWSSYTEGQVIPNTGNLYYFGQNAFADIASAFAALEDNTQSVEVVGDAAFPADGTIGTANLVINSGVTVTPAATTNVVWGSDEDDTAVLKIKGGGSLALGTDDTLNLTFQGKTTLALNGDSSLGSSGQAHIVALQGNEKMTLALTDQASLYANWGSIYDVNFLMQSATAESELSLADSSKVELYNSGIAMETISIDSAKASISTMAGSNLTADTLTNRGSIDFAGNSTGNFTWLKNYGAIIVDCSTIEAVNIINNGELTVNEGYVLVDDTFTNSGVISMTNDCYASASASFTNNDTGTLEAEESEFCVVEDFHNNGNVVLTDSVLSAASLYNYGVSASISALEGTTINITGRAPYSVDNTGIITVDSTSRIKADDCAFENTGALNLELNQNLSSVIADTFDGASGKIYVDMGDATGDKYCLIEVWDDDATKSNYGTVTILNNAHYAAAKDENGALYAYQTSTIKVDYTAETQKTSTDVAGVNYFTTLKDASDATSFGSRTYELTYASNAYMSFWTSMDSAFVNVTIKAKGAKNSLASFAVGGDTVKKVALEANTTYVVTFDGDMADYDFDADFLTTTKNTNTVIGELGAAGSQWVSDGTRNGYTFTTKQATLEDNDFVGFDTGAKVYEFSVGDTDSGTFTFDFELLDGDRFTYAIANQDGKIVSSSTDLKQNSDTGVALTRTLNLTAGNYTITVDALDEGAGEYNSYFALSITAEQNQCVSLKDNVLATTTQVLAGYGDTTGAPLEINDFVGLGDRVDYIKLNLATDGSDATALSGTYTITLDTEEKASASGLSLELIRLDGSKETVLDKLTYREGKTLAINQKMLDATKDYYVKVTVNSEASSSYNATYTLTFKRETVNDELSANDDTRRTAEEVKATDIVPTNAHEGWVGSEDQCDWIKLTDVVAGYNTFNVKVDGDMVTAEILAAKKNDLGDSSFANPNILETLYCNDGANMSRTVACTSDYDYYVRFKSQAGDNLSSFYTLSIDN